MTLCLGEAESQCMTLCERRKRANNLQPSRDTHSIHTRSLTHQASSNNTRPAGTPADLTEFRLTQAHAQELPPLMQHSLHHQSQRAVAGATPATLNTLPCFETARAPRQPLTAPYICDAKDAAP